MRKQPTGEPCAGEPHARFGGRGGETLPYPYPGEEPGPLDKALHTLWQGNSVQDLALACPVKCRRAALMQAGFNWVQGQHRHGHPRTAYLCLVFALFNYLWLGGLAL